MIRFLLFDIYYMLFRSAFSKTKEVCGDCGSTRMVKTTGSWTSLVVLILLALWVIASFTVPLAEEY